MEEVESPKPRKKRVPRKMTRSRLRNIAVHYFEQRTTTRGHLRFLLQRRIRTSLLHHEGDEAEMVAWLDPLLDELERMGLLNDRAWAISRIERLRRRGLSERAMRAKLREKRVAPELIEELLADRPVDPLLNAVRYARKRRIGPFRDHGREERQQKDLGKLARAGHPYDVAHRVLELTRDEADDIWYGGL